MSLDTVLLRDEFSDTVAAGAVNGTLSDSGHTRTVVDTDGDAISIASGLLQFANPNANWTSVGYRTSSITRDVGTVLRYKVRPNSTTTVGGFQCGLLNSTSFNNPSTAYDLGINISAVSMNLRGVDAGGIGTLLSNSIAVNDYTLFLILRANGYDVLMSTGAGNILFLWRSATGSRATLHPACSSYDAAHSVDFLRVAGYWLCTPIVSDGFSSNGTSDGLGHAETSGIGSGGDGVVWSGATWSVSGGKAINTPTLGSELLTNGELESIVSWTTGNSASLSTIANPRTGSIGAVSLVLTNGAASQGFAYQQIANSLGKWYRLTGWGRANTTSAQISFRTSSHGVISVAPTISTTNWTSVIVTGRATTNTSEALLQNGGASSGVESRYDDFSVSEIQLFDILSLHTSSTPDVFAGIDLVVTAGTQAGLALNWDSSSNPQNGVVVTGDGTNVKLEKCVAGVWTTVLSAAVTHSAGMRLVASKIGTAYRVYITGATGTLVGAGTISDAGIVNNTLHGIFSTNEGNTLDNYTCYASGTSGEYNSELQIVLSNERTSAMSLADSLLKVPVKILSDILSLSDSVLRTIIKSDPVQMALSSVAVKVPVKMLSDVLSLSDSALRTIIKSEVVQMAIDSTATKTAIKIFSDGIVFTRAQAINYGKRIIRIIRLLGNMGAN